MPVTAATPTGAAVGLLQRGEQGNICGAGSSGRREHSMSGYNDLERYEEMERYEAELKQLLAGRDLSPDTLASSLAALILADAMTEASGRMHSAAQTTLGDTMPLLADAARSFGEKAERLAWTLQRFDEAANQLSTALHRLPGY